MIDETIKSIHAQLYERAISPLIGCFIISWCSWNYKFLLIFFDDAINAESKFDVISTKVFPTWFTIPCINIDISGVFLFQGLILPALTTAIYIWGYPKLSKPIFNKWRQYQVDMINKKKEIDGLQLLSEEESQELTQKHYKLKSELTHEIKDRDDEIKSLKFEIEKKKNIKK